MEGEKKIVIGGNDMEEGSKIVIGGAEAKKETSIEKHENQEVAKFASYGGFWRRVAAMNLDYWPTMLVGIPVMIYVMSAMPEMFENMMQNLNTDVEPSFAELRALIPQSIIAAYGVYVFTYLINMAYNIYLYFTDTRTMGYRILGMEIIHEKTGSKPSAARLWGRFGGKFLTAILLVIPFINIAVIIMIIVFAVKEKKRMLHDRMANTLVVLKKKEKAWPVWVVNVGVVVLMLLIQIISSAVLINMITDESMKKYMVNQQQHELEDEEKDI